nr:SLAP domain-containing protein [Fictibacillus phosphorivorans]
MSKKEVRNVQRLLFESAWDRTLAEKDRNEIERVFSEIRADEKEGYEAILLKTAFNHKEKFLVTVLLSNYSKQPMTLLGKKVVYKERGQTLGEFESAYTLEIPAQTSMLWTFIFPEGSLVDQPEGDPGELVIQ